jgi:hypothetical protein
LQFDVGQVLLLLLCVAEWRNLAAAASLKSLRSRVDEVNGERRRLEKVVAIMRKVGARSLFALMLLIPATLEPFCIFR